MWHSVYVAPDATVDPEANGRTNLIKKIVACVCNMSVMHLHTTEALKINDLTCLRVVSVVLQERASFTQCTKMQTNREAKPPKTGIDKRRPRTPGLHSLMVSCTQTKRAWAHWGATGAKERQAD